MHLKESRPSRPSKNLEIKDVLNPIEAFLQLCTPSFSASNLMGITAEFIRQNNIHAVFLDAEGTFVKTWGTLPHIQLAEHMRSLKAELATEGYDFKTAIVTNRKMGNLATFTAAQCWAQELNADLVVSPLFPEWRKPKPFMVNLGAEQLGIPVKQVLMVGDKLTGDVVAGNRAGAKTFYVEEMVGEQDLLGDQIFRRPLERMIYRKIKHNVTHIEAPLLSTQDDQPIMLQLPQELVPDDVSWWDPQWKDSELGRQLLERPNNIYGYGIPFDDSKQKVFGSRTLYERGGEIADLLTKSRVPLAELAAILRYIGYGKTANGVQITTELTDTDGSVARRSKRGPTAAGAEEDKRQDKKAAFIRRLSLILSGKLSPTNVAVRIAADMVMTNIAQGLVESRQIDVSAVVPGKAATALESITDVVADIFSDNHTNVTNILNILATSGKVGRIPLNVALWNQRHRLREEERPILKQVALDLLTGFM